MFFWLLYLTIKKRGVNPRFFYDYEFILIINFLITGV